MPSLFRFLVTIGVIGAIVTGGLYILSTKFEPELSTVTKVVPGVKHFADWDFNTVANGIIINTETEKKNPALIRRFLRAITKGIEFAKSNPDATVAYMVERFPHKNAKVLRRELEWTFGLLATKATKGQPLGWQAKSDWSRTESVLQKNDLIKKTMPISDYFTNAYVPGS